MKEKNNHRLIVKLIKIPCISILIIVLLGTIGGCNPQDKYLRSQWFTDRGQIGMNGDALEKCSLPLTIRWQKELPGGNIFGAAPAIGGNGNIYIGHNNGTMYALDALTGNIVWEYAASSSIYNSATYVEDEKGQIKQLFFTDFSGTLYCINAEDGTLIWRNDTPDVLQVSATNYTAGVLYFTIELKPGGDDSILKGVDSQGNTVLEKQFNNFKINTTSAPLLGSGYIIVSDFTSGTVKVLDNNGTIEWATNEIDNIYPFDFNGIIDYGQQMHLITSTQSYPELKAYAYVLSSGNQVWDKSLGSRTIGLALTQNRPENHLIIQTLDNLYSINKDTGDELWSVSTGTAFAGSPQKQPQPVIWGDYVFVILNNTGGATIKGYQLSDGSEVWSHSIPSDYGVFTQSGFAVIGQTLYYTDRDYIVHAFSPE